MYSTGQTQELLRLKVSGCSIITMFDKNLDLTAQLNPLNGVPLFTNRHKL
jgi:hypothetical protein